MILYKVEQLAIQRDHGTIQALKLHITFKIYDVYLCNLDASFLYQLVGSLMAHFCTISSICDLH